MAERDVDLYSLDVPSGEPRRFAIGWLFVAIGSLILGGLLTILIVLSRTPGIQDLMPWADFFHTAIVVHVDLTVLVWFLAFAGIFWSLAGDDRQARQGWIALAIAIIGALVFTAAPFLGAGNPLMNNYVPVLDDGTFLAGLGIFGIGFSILVIRSFMSAQPLGDLSSSGGVVRFGIYTALIAALVSCVALVATYALLPMSYEGRAYYERLFWGAGHVLQFTHTQLMMVAWLWLASVAGVRMGLSPKAFLVLLAIGFVPVLGAPVIYTMYSVDSVEHIAAFTELMKWGGGIAPLVIGGVLVFSALRYRDGITRCPELSALICSILLFGVGGLIGYLISGVNVTIPAHYHGSIVSVTLAFMGVAYYLLPRLGFAAPSPKLAFWQPIVYGGGQLLHVLGLAWSGGYGVQRKTSGSAQGLDSLPEIVGMAVMGLGGLISVIGGVLFLVVALKSISQGCKNRKAHQ